MLLSNPDSEDLRRVTEEVPEDLRLPSNPSSAARISSLRQVKA
jgi:hypothetical protein